MRKLLKKYGFVPDKLVTDDLISYRAAAGQLGSSTGGCGSAGREAWGRTQLTALKENLEGSREDLPPALQARQLGIQVSAFQPRSSATPCGSSTVSR